VIARRTFPLLLLLAVALSFLAAFYDRLPGDLWVTRRVQDLPAAFETPAEVTRFLTTTWAMVILGTVLVTVFDFTARRRAWLVFTVMLLALPPIQAVIKNLVDRPRPDPALVERRASFTSESFPSGHVLGSTALLLLAGWLIAGKLPQGWPRATVWTMVVLGCALSGLANIYEGVHWPSDVLGGYLWAGVLMTAAWALAYRPSRA
jgi:undecaprenyl-diphosphatase